MFDVFTRKSSEMESTSVIYRGADDFINKLRIDAGKEKEKKVQEKARRYGSRATTNVWDKNSKDELSAVQNKTLMQNQKISSVTVFGDIPTDNRSESEEDRDNVDCVDSNRNDTNLREGRDTSIAESKELIETRESKSMRITIQDLKKKAELIESETREMGKIMNANQEAHERHVARITQVHKMMYRQACDEHTADLSKCELETRKFNEDAAKEREEYDKAAEEKLRIERAKNQEELKKITETNFSELSTLKETMNPLERKMKEEIGAREKELDEKIAVFCTEKKKESKQLQIFHKDVVASISKKTAEIEKKADLETKAMEEVYANELKEKRKVIEKDEREIKIKLEERSNAIQQKQIKETEIHDSEMVNLVKSDRLEREQVDEKLVEAVQQLEEKKAELEKLNKVNADEMKECCEFHEKNTVVSLYEEYVELEKTMKSKMKEATKKANDEITLTEETHQRAKKQIIKKHAMSVIELKEEVANAQKSLNMVKEESALVQIEVDGGKMAMEVNLSMIKEKRDDCKEKAQEVSKARAACQKKHAQMNKEEGELESELESLKTRAIFWP